MGGFGSWWIRTPPLELAEIICGFGIQICLCSLEGEWEVRPPAVYWKPHGYSLSQSYGQWQKESKKTNGQILQDAMHCYPHEFSCSRLVLVAYDCLVPSPGTSPQLCPALLQLIPLPLGCGEGELTSTHETAMDRTSQIVSSCWALRGRWFPFLCLHIPLCQKWLWCQQCKFVQKKCLPYQYGVLTLSLYCLDTADSAMCFTKQNKHLQRIVLRELRGEILNTDNRAGDILFFLCGWG